VGFEHEDYITPLGLYHFLLTLSIIMSSRLDLYKVTAANKNRLSISNIGHPT